MYKCLNKYCSITHSKENEWCENCKIIQYNLDQNGRKKRRVDDE